MNEVVPLRHKNTIAGRIALAVSRIEIDAGFAAAEAVAYKCAWHDMGSDALKHCEAAEADAAVMKGRVMAWRTEVTPYPLAVV